MVRLLIDGVSTVLENREKRSVKTEDKYDYNETRPGDQNINESSELGDSLVELNKDTIEHGRMSGIDLRSRLHYMEVSAILAVDSLVAFKFLPVDCLAFTRQKKRLAVSLDGKGRQDIVNIVAGKREQESQTGMRFGERIRGMFGGNNEKS